MSELLRLTDLDLAYGKNVVVERLNMEIENGSFTALLGPSGCGKTTTMRAIAGLLEPMAGKIHLDGTDITTQPPNRREVGLVFQSYALFPHLTVFENVAFGLRLRQKLSDQDLHMRVKEALDNVGLMEFAMRRPAALSGGQQQRVALARSVVLRPKLLLLDEPLSNLDARLRLDMRVELQRIQHESGVTMVYVTHDQAEAMALADNVIVMRAGQVEQVGAPEEIWSKPRSDFVARFVGFENIFPVRNGALATRGDPLPLPAALAQVGGVAWRPNHVSLGNGPHAGKVLGASFQGQTRSYLLQTSLGAITAEEPASATRHLIGADVKFDLPAGLGVPLEVCASNDG